MIASNGRGIVVWGQIIDVALSRARERLVALCLAAFVTDGGCLPRFIARGGGERWGGMRCPEDPGKSCIGGVSEGRHSGLLWPRDLADWIGAS
jgi:hypothetical protein